MLVNEIVLQVPIFRGRNILDHFAQSIPTSTYERPIRFAVTRTGTYDYHCEVGVLFSREEDPTLNNSIFNFRGRNFENVEKFNAVLVIPTGIGAEIGGHSGDAGAVARLLAQSCDTLILHPNAVNASDINEMPENSLYVEGSTLDRFLMGIVTLEKVRSNRVMLILDKHEDPFFRDAAINSVSAARVSLGMDITVVMMEEDRVLMRSLYSPSSGRAIGRVEYLETLCKVLEEHKGKFDAVAISTIVDVPDGPDKNYYNNEMNLTNPWGGVEAMLTHAISLLFNVPTAHAPMMPSKESLNYDVGVIDPRKSAEAVSTTNLHCVLKGLHKSPKLHFNPLGVGSIGRGLTVEDVSCLVIPDGCVGIPTLAALQQGIPVIAVRENHNHMLNDLEELPFDPGKLFIVDNYLEAVGIMNALKGGINPEAVRRPLSRTKVKEQVQEVIPTTE